MTDETVSDDCALRALPGEPKFTLLARDPSAPRKVREWAVERLEAVAAGTRPREDLGQVLSAMQRADQMEVWRIENDGSWRNLDLFVDVPVAGELSETYQNEALGAYGNAERMRPDGSTFAADDLTRVNLLEPKCAGAHAQDGICARCGCGQGGICMDTAAHVAQREALADRK